MEPNIIWEWNVPKPGQKKGYINVVKKAVSCFKEIVFTKNGWSNTGS